MPQEAGSPGSNADSSINNSKIPAVKDKECPFCHQPFTSSSLGRHLDLYIKEKNPKQADGVHDVVSIRKLRGSITRRQPRNSLANSRRDGSTPSGTPGANGGHSGRRSPISEAGGSRRERPHAGSPVVGRYIPDAMPKSGLVQGFFEKPSWHATGVINDIPPVVPADPRAREDERGNGSIYGNRTVSKQSLSKSMFDQKQKMADALDTARASELALREVLGSMRAAIQRINPAASPFDYDPLSFDFPALTLQCLPPPPTLKSVSPLPSRDSWSINPPDAQQYDALRMHFSSAFKSFRAQQAIHSAIKDDPLEYPPPATPDSGGDSNPANSSASIAILQTNELEDKIRAHLHATFSHWNNLPQQQRIEYWRLELARAVGAKSKTIDLLRTNTERIMQENVHLRMQVEQLSRCQQPREFQMMPPATVPIDAKTLSELAEAGIKRTGVGLGIADKDETIQEMVSRSIQRWKVVVQSARGGMAAQRQFEPPSRESSGSFRQSSGVGQQGLPTETLSIDVSMDDADADADADAEADAEGDEDSDVPAPQPGREQHAQTTPRRSSGRNSNMNSPNFVNGSGNRRSGRNVAPIAPMNGGHGYGGVGNLGERRVI